MMATVKAYAKSLGILAALFLSFRYLADFSSNQSWVLAIIACLGYGLYESLQESRRVEKGFSPFYVSVSPNWHDLLRDYKLINSDEEWHQLREKSDNAPISEYNALRSGILFSVLHPRPDAYLPGLIYLNSRRSFASEVDFEERIEEIRIHRESGQSFVADPKGSPLGQFRYSIDFFTPEFCVKLSASGYELGLEVDGNWWEQICAADERKELAKTKADAEHLTGTTRLLVATLPHSEFDIYFREAEYDDERRKKRDERKNAQLAERGWKREDLDPELALLGAPIRIEHKYFTVQHRSI